MSLILIFRSFFFVLVGSNRKRSRDEDNCDFMPISKRINNLSITNQHHIFNANEVTIENGNYIGQMQANGYQSSTNYAEPNVELAQSQHQYYHHLHHNQHTQSVQPQQQHHSPLNNNGALIRQTALPFTTVGHAKDAKDQHDGHLRNHSQIGSGRATDNSFANHLGIVPSINDRLHQSIAVHHQQQHHQQQHQHQHSRQSDNLNGIDMENYSPELSATENPFYYNKNKLLFDLHLERERRNQQTNNQ